MNHKFNWNGAALAVALMEGDGAIPGPIAGDGYVVSRSAEGYSIEIARGEFTPDAPAGGGESPTPEPTPEPVPEPVVPTPDPTPPTAPVVSEPDPTPPPVSEAPPESSPEPTEEPTSDDAPEPKPEATGSAPAPTGAEATG